MTTTDPASIPAPAPAPLAPDTLRLLPADVARPHYDRALLRPGVVHLGLGNFARAHLLAVLDTLAGTGDPRWGVIGVSLRSPAVRDRLRPQHQLYTLLEHAPADDPTGDRLRVIGALLSVLVAPEDPAAVLAALCAADTHLVTLSVTEKGYGLSPASGELDRADPDIAHDLHTLDAPRSAPGFLAAALLRRRAAGVPPFTALSCDNLSGNGVRLRRAVLELARAHDPAGADWIADRAAFPSTMVDRIVPATTDAAIAAAAARSGLLDQAAIETEAFLQWVIEDRFCCPRPDFARVSGVTLTAAVAPWEDAKLRLLNGAHSAIAYLGGLHGIAHVHEFVARPEGRRLVRALWSESAATLSPPPELDLDRYQAALLHRFADPALRHRTAQIAVDGSRKLPQRLLAPLIERLAHGQPAEALCFAVAAWMRWQSGLTRAGTPFVVEDPLAPVTARALLAAGGEDDARCSALLALREVFPASLAGVPAFDHAVRRHYHRLRPGGATLAALVDALPAP